MGAFGGSDVRNVTLVSDNKDVSNWLNLGSKLHINNKRTWYNEQFYYLFESKSSTNKYYNIMLSFSWRMKIDFMKFRSIIVFF